MARYVWTTADGKDEAKKESAKGIATFQHNRDRRKAKAIALYDSGLDANEIAQMLSISRRTVNRYLSEHITLTPDAIKPGIRVHLISEKKGNLMHRAPGTHYWVIRKLYELEGDPYAEIEKINDPDGTAYLQVRIGNLCKAATKAR